MDLFNKNTKALTNIELEMIAYELKVKHFRGVFMRDTLPNKVKNIECGIINLASSKNDGTHWCCYYKNLDRSYYFDSFGLDPPIELQKYLNSQIELSTFQIQKFNTSYCGHLCILVLKLLETCKFKEIILDLIMSMS